METTITQRIKQVLNFYDVSENSLANQMGVSQTTINSALKPEKDSVSSKILTGVWTVFPQLNITWLLTGEGEMLNGGDTRVATEEDGGLAARVAALEERAARQDRMIGKLTDSIGGITRQNDRLLSIIERLTAPAAPSLTAPCKKLTPAES